MQVQMQVVGRFDAYVREANLQIILDHPAFIEYLALLVLHPLLLSLNEQRKSDQLFTVDRLLSAYSFFQINICVTKLLFVCHLRLNTL